MTKYRCVSLIVTSYRHRGVPNGELQTLATGRSTVATKHLSLITLWLVTPSVDGQRYGLWLQCDVRPSSVVADQSNAAAAAAAAACCTLTYLYAVCRHSWPSSVMIRYIQPLYYGDWKPTDDNRTSKSHVILRFFSPEKFLRPFHESGIERVVAAQATSAISELVISSFCDICPLYGGKLGVIGRLVYFIYDHWTTVQSQVGLVRDKRQQLSWLNFASCIAHWNWYDTVIVG